MLIWLKLAIAHIFILLKNARKIVWVCGARLHVPAAAEKRTNLKFGIAARRAICVFFSHLAADGRRLRKKDHGQPNFVPNLAPAEDVQRPAVGPPQTGNLFTPLTRISS